MSDANARLLERDDALAELRAFAPRPLRVRRCGVVRLRASSGPLRAAVVLVEPRSDLADLIAWHRAGNEGDATYEWRAAFSPELDESEAAFRASWPEPACTLALRFNMARDLTFLVAAAEGGGFYVGDSDREPPALWFGAEAVEPIAGPLVAFTTARQIRARLAQARCN